MKIVKKIIENPILILLIMLKDLIEIFEATILKIPTASMNIDWWDFSIKLVIAVALWYVIKKFIQFEEKTSKKFDELQGRIEFETSAQAILNNISFKSGFLNSYRMIEYGKVPGETDEHFWNRIPEGGMLKRELLRQYEEAKYIIAHNWKNKSVNEIEAFLKPLFPDDIFNQQSHIG